MNIGDKVYIGCPMCSRLFCLSDIPEIAEIFKIQLGEARRIIDGLNAQLTIHRNYRFFLDKPPLKYTVGELSDLFVINVETGTMVVMSSELISIKYMRKSATIHFFCLPFNLDVFDVGV